MTVLVTGAAGFLGSHVMAALAGAGRDATGFDVAAPGAEALAVAPTLRDRLVQGQVTDAARLFDVCCGEEIDAVVHTASLVGIESSLQQPSATYQTNVMGFVNLCEAARQTGMRRLVLISSNAVYHAGSRETLAETDAVFSVERGNPAGHYGTSKMMQEAVALAYATSYDLDVVILRVTAIYGFGMRAPLYIKPMVENAVRGTPTRIASGGPMKRDYTYVHDCADAILLALDAPRNVAGSRVLNVSAGCVHTAAAVAEVVRRIVPGADIEIGAVLAPAEAESAKMRAPLDISAAHTTLGWSPRWTIEAGVADYAKRFLRFCEGC